MAGEDHHQAGDGNRYEGEARNVVQAHRVDVMNVYNTPGAVRVEPPSALPPAANRFHDREPLLRQITEAVSVKRHAGEPTVVIVAGLRGVGKTAMAVHWATLERDRFPDGLLYSDLGGLSRRGMGGGIGETVTYLLEQLGISGEHLPRSDQGRLALLRSRLARGRVFLLLDNARLATEVERLLPASPDSVVFVTTGGELTEVADLAGRQNAEVILLRELSDEVSLDLLRSLIGNERVDREIDGARALLRVCGGWPLAIRLAAGRLKTRRTLGLADLAARLEAAHRDPHRAPKGEWVVHVVGDEVYGAMPDEVRRAYRMLSLHPGAGDRPTPTPRAGRGPRVVFGIGAAAALLGCTEADADALLDELVNRHLLDEEADRFVFHDLIRLHARSSAEHEETDEDRDAAVRNVAEWYLRAAAEADLAVNSHRPTTGPVFRELRGRSSPYGSGPEGVRRGLAWLRAEHQNLCALVYAAEDRGWHDLAWQLCEALWGFYLSLKHYDQWIETHRIGLRAAERLGDAEARFRMGIQLGRGLYETRRFAEAHEVLAGTLEVVTDPLDRATTLEFVGRAHLDAGEPAKALPFFQQSKELEETHGRIRGVGINLHHLGRTYLALGRVDDAVRCLDRAQEIFEDIPDPYNRGRTLITVGRAHLMAERAGPAAAALGTALEIMRAEGRTYQIGEIYESLAHVAAMMDDPAHAAELRAAAIAAYDEVGSPRADELRDSP
ncbi:tetratricopeptide repeat protein [Actinomadura rudentiformis]|uniref:tetratricopeptide repeat protein n=1 Tax=Actinomadura rudentiformis TaxID=359158 RepID=UPI00178C3474|nr:tetratricopeptide repeat protein [Actinomadura rudentiformis]